MVSISRLDLIAMLLLIVPAIIRLLLITFPLLMGEKGGGGVVDVSFYLDRGVEFQM